MDEYGHRAKAFFQWLEQRILQREFIYARMENGRNKELMKAELIEAKQIRDRFVSHMQAPTSVKPQAPAATPAASPARPVTKTVVIEDAVEVPATEPKGRTLH